MAFFIYEIKLKIGFFKTELCDLYIYDDKIVLAPKENTELHEIVITNESINSISLIKKNTKFFEIEIGSQQGMFVGTIFLTSESEKLFGILIKKFGRKVYI